MQISKCERNSKMQNSELTIRNEEQIIFSLRSLFEKYGYSQYKMTKFEEYDLYVRNKDFLMSDNVITFNDTNGKLMALKPDVTLSIIKNSKDVEGGLNKVYYNENVYRVSKSTGSFKEIMQTGLECLGDIDDYCISEVLTLAAKCLGAIPGKSILCIGNLDIVSYAVEKATDDKETKKAILCCIGEKNLHSLSAICSENGISDENKNILSSLVSLHGVPSAVISKLKEIIPECEVVNKFEKILSSLDNSIKEIIDIDFSYVGDFKYYNGLVFKGFIDGIPTAVISGGQYDKLMKKMGRSSKAIGFAVYLDCLDRLDTDGNEYDVDTVLLYDENADISSLGKEVENLTAAGNRVLATKKCPEKLRYKQLITFDKEGAKI